MEREPRTSLSVPPAFLEALPDRYIIERELGRGGMAVVYLARDLKHHRLVAIKVLGPELSAALGERFLREIEIAAGLTQPHILTLHDSGEAGGSLYYVMPYVEGESLRERINREGQLPIDDALRIAREVASALGYAHRHDVVHRDIKPGNILLQDNNAIVADFGIARAISRVSGEPLTSTGVALGTPAYMSPEQASGERDLDGRTDIYSLGCVLYEMLAGEPPYTGPTVAAIMAKRFIEPIPRVSTLRESASDKIENAITKALAKNPADRYATAAEFEAALATPPVSIESSSRRVRKRSKPWAIFAGALSIALVAFVVFRAATNHDGGSPPAQKMVAVLPFENLGRPEDAYFADGMTEAITGRLASLKGLRVIGRQSAIKYAKTNKSVQQIGTELGVSYLLTGTVRWDRSAQTRNTVRISPALLKVSDGTVVWGEPFESVLSGVFEVQSSVAKQVAGALDVALGAGEQKTLAEKPTKNMEAYDYFLRGNEYRIRSFRPEDNRLAAELYRKTVAIDPEFALAWADLSMSETDYFWFFGDRSPAPLVRAKSAVDRAFALDPDLPAAHVALGVYYYHGFLDYEHALGEFSVAERNDPNNVDLMHYKASVERRQGKYDEAVRDFQRTAELDPRNARHMVDLGHTYICLRDYPNARKAADRSLQLSPDLFAGYTLRTESAIGMGNTNEAIKSLREGVAISGSAAFPDLWDYVWPAVLEPDLKSRMIAEKWEAGNGPQSTFYVGKAILYRNLADSVMMRLYADSAVHSAKQSISGRPDEPTFYHDLGLALALLGRKSEANGAAAHATQLLPPSKDGFAGAPHILNQALVGTLNGDNQLALRFLQQVMSVRGYVNPGWTRLDPIWEPLRRDARFKQVAGG